MNINLHIERLVLDGLPVTAAQGAAMQSALQSELTRLLTERGIGDLSDRAVPHLPVASLTLSAGGPPGHWGRQLARTLYDGISPAPTLPAKSEKADRPSTPRAHDFSPRSFTRKH